MENSIDKEKTKDLIEKFFNCYQDLCDETSNEGAVLFYDTTHNNKMIMFKSDKDTADKIYEYTKDITR